MSSVTCLVLSTWQELKCMLNCESALQMFGQVSVSAGEFCEQLLFIYMDFSMIPFVPALSTFLGGGLLYKNRKKICL